MLKQSLRNLRRAALIIAPVAASTACSNFQQRYDYQAGAAEISSIHQVISDHDNDGVRDFGDLCITNGSNYFVDKHGCDPYREASQHQPFSIPEQCTLLHSESTDHE